MLPNVSVELIVIPAISNYVSVVKGILWVSNSGLTHKTCVHVSTTVHSVWFIPLTLMRIVPSWFSPVPLSVARNFSLLLPTCISMCAVINVQLPVYWAASNFRSATSAVGISINFCISKLSYRLWHQHFHRHCCYAYCEDWVVILSFGRINLQVRSEVEAGNLNAVRRQTSRHWKRRNECMRRKILDF